MSGIFVGLISGTSADAVDAAVVRTNGRGASLLSFVAVPFPALLRSRILMAAGGAAVGTAEIASLDAEIGRRFAAAAIAAAKAARVPLRKIRAIGSHGQTVWHAPKANPPVTMQLGDPHVIAERTGVDVVADFRRRDVAAGGEGAPLVPIAHLELFGHARIARAVQNLGGIGNVTVLPAGRKASGVFAFDTGPANMVIDGLVQFYSAGRKRYDRGGAMSARGAADGELVAELLRAPFFRRSPPKSTGREVFGRGYVARLLEVSRRRRLAPEDLLATAAELTARSIAESYRKFVLPQVKVKETLLCGGGVHNREVVRRIRGHLGPLGITVRSTAELGVDPDAIEAIAFALLARDTLLGRPGNVPRATGAKGPRVLGCIVPA